MPTTPKPRQKRSALSPLQQRIRDAERKQAPIGTERVGVDEEGYEMVAVLCERGMGRKSEVLRLALASGLKAMKAASEPVVVEREPYDYIPPDGPGGTFSLGTPVLANSVPFSAVPITTPPSQQRLLEEPEEEAVE